MQRLRRAKRMKEARQAGLFDLPEHLKKMSGGGAIRWRC